MKIYTNMLNINEYTTPEIEFIQLAFEGVIMSQSSTGESYNGQQRYDGTWN